MQQLIQQKGFHYRAYVLREDDLLVHIRDFQQEREFSVDYLDLGLQFYRRSKHEHRLTKWIAGGVAILSGLALLLIGLGVFALPFGSLFWVAMLSSLIWLWASLKQEPPMMHLVGGEQQLDFLADEPSFDELQDFLEALCKNVRDAYQDQYLDENVDIPAEERRSRIQWLHQMKVLTRSEKDILLAELGPLRQKSIGFQRTA